MSNRTTKKKTKIQQRSTAESILLLFPLILAIIVVPLIVKMHTYNTGLNIYDWYTVSDDAADFFLFYKQWFFVGICGLAVVIIAGRAFIDKKTVKYQNTLLPLFIYAGLAFLSTLFSKYRSTGFSGAYEQFENVFCILGYVLMVYYAFLMIQSEDELRLLINSVAIGALIIGIIGTFQAFGLDFFASDSGKSLIVEPGVNIDDLSVVFDGGRAYGTLYNPNYLGVYTSLMIPLFTLMFFFSKKLSEYLLYGAVVITSIISLVASQSKSGIISIAVGFIFAAIMLRKYLLTKWKIIVPAFAVLIITFVVINAKNDNAYVNALKNAFSTTSVQHSLTAIDSKEDHIEVTFNDETFKLSLDASHNLVITDSNDLTLSYDFLVAGDGYTMYLINDVRFSEVMPFVYTDTDALAANLDFGIYYNDESYIFSSTYDKDQYTYYNRYGRFSPIKTAESAVFTGHEKFASGRGYIWSRTIPLMKKYIFLGAGADSFLEAFPQYDYVAYKHYDYNPILISKPHSLYLQIGVQSGVVSLIAFLAFFIIYLIQSVRLYFKNTFETVSSKIGVAVCAGVISYLISGISNDSSISVAPVFWCIVGIGFTANIICRSTIKTEK